MGIETIGGLGDYNIPDEYNEEDKERFRQRILLEEELDYQKLHEYKPLISILKDEHLQKHGQEFTGDTRELVDDYAWDMTWFEDNEASTFKIAMEERTDQQNYDLGLKMHVWDRVHNRDWWKIARDHTAALASAPSTLASIALAPVTMGVGSLWLKGGAVAAQQASKQAIKKSFYNTVKGGIQKNIHKNIVKTVAGESAIEGAGWGTQEFYEQDVQQQALSPETIAPIREEKDYDSILISGALGASIGAAIPTALYAGGKGLKAVLKKEMAQSVDQPFGRTPFEELRVVQPEKQNTVNKLFGSAVGRLIKGGLTSSAGMPQQLADIHSTHLRKLNAMDEDINRTISDFEVLFKKTTGKDFSTLSEDQMIPYFKLLHGDTSKNVIGSMDKNISDKINLMRTKIADTSQYALDSGMIKDKKLQKTMLDGIRNKKYVNYSYRLHSDDEWAKKIQGPERQRWNEAEKFLQDFYTDKKGSRLKTDDEIRAIMTSIINESPSKTKILAQFTKRQEIAPEIRRLMGQEVDVRDIFKSTVSKAHSAAAEHEFRTNFVNMGGDLGVLSRENNIDLKSLGDHSRDFSLDNEGLATLIEEHGQKISNPFDGVYGQDSFMKAYSRMRSADLDPQSIGTTALSGLNAIFSVGHTVYSPITVSRNVAGGGIINLAAGNWLNPAQKAMNKTGVSLPNAKTGAWESHDKQMTGAGALFKRLARKTDIGEEGLLLIREGIELCILQQGVRAEVLQRNLNDLSAVGGKIKTFESTMHKLKQNVARGQKSHHKVARQIKRKGVDTPIRFYGLMDDINKLWAWDTEFRALKLSYGNNEGKYFIPKRLAMSSRYGGVNIPDPIRGGRTSTTLGQYARNSGEMVEVSEKALKSMAAKKSTMYYPTYDQVPPWIKALRKIPFGNFVAFPTEMVRSTKNSLMLGLEEIYSGNRVMAARGMTRLASTATVAGGFGGGVTGMTALGLSFITGRADAEMTPEEVEAFKRSQPHSTGGDFFFHSREVKGDKQVIKATNMAYSDPYSVFKEPIRVAMMAYQEGANLEETQSQLLSALYVGAEEFFSSYFGTKQGLKPFLTVISSGFDEEMSERDMKSLFYSINKTYSPKVIQDLWGFGTNMFTSTEQTEWGTNVPSMQDYGIGLMSGGLRPKDYDLDMNFTRKISKLQKESNETYFDFKTILTDKSRKNSIDINILKDEYRKAIKNDIDVQKQLWGVVRDMRTLGMSDFHIGRVLTHHPSIFQAKRISGRKMSANNAMNLLDSQPLYFVKTIDSFRKGVAELDEDRFIELQKVQDEFSLKEILLNE